MPKRLLSLLSENDTVQHGFSGCIDVVFSMLEADAEVDLAVLCDPDIQLIGKMKHGLLGEGYNFCGYHNIQMQISCLRKPQYAAVDEFEKGIPSILRLQDLIEQAWDRGFNDEGRIQTGGIRNTRKYIGTQEAHALFTSLGLMTIVNSIETNDRESAWEQLLQIITNYFMSTEGSTSATSKVTITKLPPIFLQRLGHSMTIIGIESKKDGTRSLLLFDPQQRLIAESLSKNREKGNIRADRKTMERLRHLSSSLQKRQAFEILWIEPSRQNEPIN